MTKILKKIIPGRIRYAFTNSMSKPIFKTEILKMTDADVGEDLNEKHLKGEVKHVARGVFYIDDSDRDIVKLDKKLSYISYKANPNSSTEDPKACFIIDNKEDINRFSSMWKSRRKLVKAPHRVTTVYARQKQKK